MTSPAPAVPLQESRLLLIIAAVQFVNILDFMMVMPLGPDFSRDLGIAPAHLGIIGGAYTAAAALSGIAAATFLDRLDRRQALLLAMVGLAGGTLLGAFAWDLPSLLAARVLAGVFGGPATAVSLSIVADAIPPERRGKAMGTVMGAFSIASVLGVPAGLELARLGSWRTPFLCVGALGLALVVAVAAVLPAMRGHIGQKGADVPFSTLVRRPPVLGSLVITALLNAAGFVLIPNISPFMLMNVGYPREHLGLLYMVGGVTSLLALRLFGPLVDRYGHFPLFALGTLAMMITVTMGFYPALPLIPPLLLFPLMMGSMSARNVSLQTLTSKVPQPAERARLQSAQSAVQHLAAAAGAVGSSALLDPTVKDRLVGLDKIVIVCLLLSLPTFPLVRWLESSVKGRAQ